jgi:hypothetical protein
VDKPLNFLEWFDAKIVVFGSNIDVYINKQHVAHYFIPDPIRWENVFVEKDEDEEARTKQKLGKRKYVASINYSSGKVGFRCSGNEHAHFRSVKVKPLME